MGLLFGRGRSRSVFGYIPLVRWVGPGVTLAGILAAGYFVLTGRIDLSALDQYRGTPTQEVVAPVKLQSLGEKTPETIRVASFNIQVFGRKKAGDLEVMQNLARIVTQFDVVAVQEVRDANRSALPVEQLVDLIDRSGSRYRATISAPIGRTSQKESYAFVWDETRIRLVPDSAYVVRDDDDRMHREPMVATFQARTAPADGRLPFRFTLINVHTDPDEVPPHTDAESPENELNVLDDVFNRVRDYEYALNRETDFILLGDLNVDGGNLGELGQIANVVSVAGNVVTNTAGTKTYDHIVLDKTMTQEFTGRSGVVDFVGDLGLSPEDAERVSDHLPVWAEFSAYEAPSDPSVATRRGTDNSNRPLRIARPTRQ